MDRLKGKWEKRIFNEALRLYEIAQMRAVDNDYLSLRVDHDDLFSTAPNTSFVTRIAKLRQEGKVSSIQTARASVEWVLENGGNGDELYVAISTKAKQDLNLTSAFTEV